jgi:hypothetical protein
MPRTDENRDPAVQAWPRARRVAGKVRQIRFALEANSSADGHVGIAQRAWLVLSRAINDMCHASNSECSDPVLNR